MEESEPLVSREDVERESWREMRSLRLRDQCNGTAAIRVKRWKCGPCFAKQTAVETSANRTSAIITGSNPDVGVSGRRLGRLAVRIGVVPAVGAFDPAGMQERFLGMKKCRKFLIFHLPFVIFHWVAD